MTVRTQHIHREVREGVEYKVCTSCQTLKTLSEFHVQSAAHDGRHTKCKECVKVVYRRTPVMPKRLAWALQHPNTEKGRRWLVMHGANYPQLVAMVKPADLVIPWLGQDEIKANVSIPDHRFQTARKIA